MAIYPNVPSRKQVAIVPNDTTDLLPLAIRVIYVGVGGNVAVQAADDSSPLTYQNVPSGVILPVSPAKVFSAGTTADGLIGLL